MKKNNIAILTQVNSRNAGGLFNSVKSLALRLNLLDGINLGYFSYNDQYSKNDLYTYHSIKMIVYKVISLGGFKVSLNLFAKLNSFKPAIIHQQGIWMSYSWVALVYKTLNSKVKSIITPRGMLDPWALQNSRKKKLLVAQLYENKNLRKADCILALCHSEYLSIRRYGLKNPVAIIPNGVNLPSPIQSETISRPKNKKTLLFIGRIHPKKGLVNLIKAIALIKEKNPAVLKKWRIRIAGWSELDHREELESLCASLKLNSLVYFVGSVYGVEKEQELVNADVFILPSYSEGLPMSVLEAWSYKLPVIMTKECNIPVGFEVKAAIEVQPEVEDIAEKLLKILKMRDENLSQIGANGYELVKNRFTWDQISEETSMVYDWLLNKIEKPEFIRLD